MADKPGAPRVPNAILRRIREQERQETRAEFAEALRRKAGELGEAIFPNERFVARLEDGVTRYPRASARRVLSALCGRSVTELGFTRRGARVTGSAITADLVPAGLTGQMTEPAENFDWINSAKSEYDRLIIAQHWPTWFGVNLARLIGMVDNWTGPMSRIDSLQALLHEEFLMFDAVAPEGPDSEHVVHALARRQALVALAALPMTIVSADRIASDATRTIGAAQDIFLSRCAASITACWHLLRGSDLPTVDKMLSHYLIPLEATAYQPSKYQGAAATLASQAHRISGILALHRDQIRVREHHCKRALHYATVASDVSSQASALISLASTYFYESAPAKAAAVYERALALESAIPPLQRSRVHAELSVVYAQAGREREAIRSGEHAEEFYPAQPEQDPSFLYAEFTPASLTLEKGLAFVALAEQFPSGTYQHKAAEVFARLNDGRLMPVPDRIRYEIINHQARTAVLLDDLDAFEAYFRRGLEGVVLLGSKQRHRESRLAWERASERWPRERRINALTERLQLTGSKTQDERSGQDV
jgi:tetratricopeptide (TPR) repeat protein